MADLVESCFGGDGAYGVVGRLEAPCGFGEAEFGEVLVGRGVQARLEAAGAFRLADAGACCHVFEGDVFAVVLFDVLEDLLHAEVHSTFLSLLRKRDVLPEGQPERGKTEEDFVGVVLCLFLFHIGQDGEIFIDGCLPCFLIGEGKAGDFLVFRDAVDDVTGGAAFIEAKEISWKDEAFVMTVSKLADGVDDVLIDEESLPLADFP